MNDIFNDQKEQLLSLSHEINLLRQQVDYLLRNGKALGLLDLDVLMNRTHTIYDTLCSINLGQNDEEQDVEIDPEALLGLLGATATAETEPESQPEEAPESEEETLPEAVPQPEAEAPVAPEPLQEEVPVEVPPIVEEQGEEAPEDEEKPKEDPFGFIFRFEENLPAETDSTEEPTEERQEEAVDNQEEEPVVVGDKIVHFVKEAPEDDLGFELAAPETLGEKMLQDDHSLAAKLQQKPVRDLKSVIGINDKFLFVNELFGGSMEKYTKSIENLNDLKTLNGAMIYLNELKIELQWNSSNEAYQKLSDLISRKFEQ